MATELVKLDPKMPVLHYSWDSKMFKELHDLQNEFLELLQEVEDLKIYENNINTQLVPQQNELYNYKLDNGLLEADDKEASTKLTGHIDKRWMTFGQTHLNYGFKLLYSSLAKDVMY